MLATTAALALLTACGSSGGAGAGGDARPPGPSVPQVTAGSATPARQSYDPPTAFDQAMGVPMPPAASLGRVTLGGSVVKPLPVALDGLTAYVAATDGLQAVDVTSGKVVGGLAPANPALRPSSTLSNDNPATAPVIATVGGRSEVLVAFLEKVPGQGTTAGHDAIELAAMDAGTHQSAWTLSLDVPDGVLDPYDTRSTGTLLGVRGSTAVLQVADSSHGAALAVDLTARKLLWQQTSFTPKALTDSGVVGIVPKDPAGVQQNVSALALADGHPLWNSPKDSYQTAIAPAGPTTVAVWDRDYGSGKSEARLLDAATGHPTVDLGTDLTGTDCRYDDRSVTVCSTGGTVVAVDATTGQQLWKLPDDAAHRVAPKVSAVWHGLVYGTTENGPVILDARSGADHPGTPAAAPVLVNGYSGLALSDKQDGLFAYPAVG
ncbi:PQQ-binding-like beta-propeller repeat protein [Kitasatospora nipponensis]